MFEQIKLYISQQMGEIISITIFFDDMFAIVLFQR